MRYILLISLGPIQDFIASARQCQDLWFGSWLLSDLASVVARSLKSQSETLIFPADINDEKQQQGIANKIMAIVKGSPEDVRNLAEESRDKMKKRLLDIADKAFAKIKPIKENHFRKEVAIEQLSDLIEFLWVAVPMSDTDSYRVSRLKAEQLLAARKNSKNWTQPKWDRSFGVPKSSIDGMRESVLHEDIYPQRRSRRKDQKNGLSLEERRKKYFVKDTERLCGVGLLKRIGTDANSSKLFSWGKRGRPLFHSSSHMAGIKLLGRWNRSVQQAFGAYIETLKTSKFNVQRFLIHTSREIDNDFTVTDFLDCEPINSLRLIDYEGKYYDSAILFPSRIESAIKEQNLQKQQKTIEKSLQALLGQLDTFEPYQYYVMLLADGDKMGKSLDQLAEKGFENQSEVPPL